MIFKKIFYSLFVLALLSSCAKDSNNSSSSSDGIVSQWELIEQYSDPGDGSGGFEPVSGQKYVIFNEDATVTCYGDLCSMLLEDTEISNGTYDDMAMTITADECSGQLLFYAFEDSKLIISYPGDEPCQEKYIETIAITFPTN